MMVGLSRCRHCRALPTVHAAVARGLLKSLVSLWQVVAFTFASRCRGRGLCAKLCAASLCASSSRSSHFSSQAPKPTARGTPSEPPAPAVAPEGHEDEHHLRTPPARRRRALRLHRNIEQHGAHCLEEKLAELMSLGVRPGTADDVPPFVLAAAAVAFFGAGAMRQLLLRFFLVPSSGHAQATTLSAGSTRTSPRSGSRSRQPPRCGTARTALSASGRRRSCRRRSWDDRGRI